MDQESCRTFDVPLIRDFLGSASTFRTFITTTVFFIIADRLSVAAVPCEIAGAMPVGDGTQLAFLRFSISFRTFCLSPSVLYRDCDGQQLKEASKPQLIQSSRTSSQGLHRFPIGYFRFSPYSSNLNGSSSCMFSIDAGRTSFRLL